MTFFTRKNLKGHKKQAIFLFIALIIPVITSCSEQPGDQHDNLDTQNRQDGWAQRLSSQDTESLSFKHLDQWIMVRETHRDNITSLHLERPNNDEDTIKLIITILPIVLYEDELLFEAKKMLESSLHNIQSVEVRKKLISNLKLIILDYIVGETGQIKVRAAGFSSGGRSYLFTILANEDSFSDATIELEMILSSIDLD